MDGEYIMRLIDADKAKAEIFGVTNANVTI